jgi:hypothetical protein
MSESFFESRTNKIIKMSQFSNLSNRDGTPIQRVASAPACPAMIEGSRMNKSSKENQSESILIDDPTNASTVYIVTTVAALVFVGPTST